MLSGITVPAVAAIVALGAALYMRIKRGRRLLVIRREKGTSRWMLNLVLLGAAVIAFTASGRKASGSWDVIGSAALLVLALSDMGFDLQGRPRPGECVLHERGILMFADRVPVFVKWSDVERYEWQGSTVTFHVRPAGLAHVPDIRAFDVPPERFGEVMAIVGPRVGR